MKKNRLVSLALALIVAVVCLSGCNGIKKLEDIRITSANVGGIVPNGLKGVVLDCRIGVDNPGAQISLSDIYCDLKYFGKVLGKVAVDPFTLNAKSEEIYNLKANVTLGENVSILDLGRLMNKTAVEDFTVDVQARVKLKGGISRELVLNDIPLKKLIETAKR